MHIIQKIFFAALVILALAGFEGEERGISGHALEFPEGTALLVSQKKEDHNQNQEHNRAERTAEFQCTENCAKEKQTCEQNALKQEDERIAKIGSKENNEWSRNCQLTYYKCSDGCK